MAIGTNDLVNKFGTQDTVTSSSSAVTDGSFSVSGDITSWTNDDDADLASVTFEGTYSVAPTAETSVNLYAQLMNVVSTSDNDTPDANFPHTFLGSFPLNDVTSEQFITIDIQLPNAYTSAVYDFYIQNGGGQTISAGWDLHVTPKVIGPHA
jgi:hypothetical protein